MTTAGGEAYEQLDELYDVWCAEVVEDIPFYLGLAASLAGELGRDGLDVIELGGGSGRISVPLAAAGHRVTAIDASGRQLQRLQGKAEELGVADRIRTIEGDMRDLVQHAAPASADLVLAPFRSLLHVTPDRDDVFAAVSSILRPAGAFAFDVFHPDHEQVAATHDRWIHRRAERTEHGKLRFDERARYTPREDLEPGALELAVDVRARSRRTDERTALLQLLLVPADRWRASIERAGLQLDGAYGWFDAHPLEAGDDDSVWVARAPQA